ncbi:uncharacterized protein HKW66_Vig0167700 [Vigna angularis]|uniref:60S ribosomal export protein NMD3 n=1 Tax=Phaseolus angularis TaxID=3914 RepID=A0A8T0JQM1_PHAAN|nr:uncharacterized protein HKW66_Vig0167700 [Vigna angularis]
MTESVHHPHRRRHRPSTPRNIRTRCSYSSFYNCWIVTTCSLLMSDYGMQYKASEMSSHNTDNSNPELCINFGGKLRTVLLISDFSERRAASVSITGLLLSPHVLFLNGEHVRDQLILILHNRPLTQASLISMFSSSGRADGSDMFKVHQTIGSALCCKCGIPMQPNAANMCVKCLSSEVDITEGLLKGLVLVIALSVRVSCSTKKLVKVKVQKEVINGAILEQSYTVEYVQQEHMRTFFYLEQLILKNGAAASAIKIKQMEQVAVSLGNIGLVVICTKVTNSIALLDPFTLRHCFLDADQYWRTAFQSLLTSRQLVEYLVLDVEVVSSETHVGNLLNPGDYALGCELYEANSNDMELDKYKGHILEAILIKKSYEEKRQKKRGKHGSLNHLKWMLMIGDLIKTKWSQNMNKLIHEVWSQTGDG